LPRAFVPARVETVADDGLRLERMSDPGFRPRDVAYVELPVRLPAECHGTAEIVADAPAEVTVKVRMDTAGLLVLADRWDRGWRASLNGTPLDVLQVDHALRGVVVPPGDGTVVFQYRPRSLTVGLLLAGVSAAGLASCLWFRRGRGWMGGWERPAQVVTGSVSREVETT